jgi:hypothetical protein
MTARLQMPMDQIAALRSDDVQLYLASHGWARDEESSTAQGTVFKFPTLRDAEVLLPRRRNLADYVQRMADVVEMLAAVEERPSWQVFADLSAPSADILRLQVTAPDATLGALPLEEGIRLFQGARSLLLASACSARQAAPYFPRQAYREAVELLQTCQLGQTERGSFVAKILAPVPPQINKQAELFEPDDESLLASEPFARRSTVRLMTGLRHIQSAIEKSNYAEILRGVDVGVSANLCEAVASIRPEGDQAQVQIRMTWSPNRPMVLKSIASVVDFSQTTFEIVREAGRKLRESPLISRVRIEGRVINLKADPSLFDQIEGTIVLRAEVNGAATRVHLELPTPDYKKACDAHRDGNIVTVTGLLQREAKLFHLLQPQDFAVIANP